MSLFYSQAKEQNSGSRKIFFFVFRKFEYVVEFDARISNLLGFELESINQRVLMKMNIKIDPKNRDQGSNLPMRTKNERKSKRVRDNIFRFCVSYNRMTPLT